MLGDNNIIVQQTHQGSSIAFQDRNILFPSQNLYTSYGGQNNKYIPQYKFINGHHGRNFVNLS